MRSAPRSVAARLLICFPSSGDKSLEIGNDASKCHCGGTYAFRSCTVVGARPPLTPPTLPPHPLTPPPLQQTHPPGPSLYFIKPIQIGFFLKVES